MEIKKMQKTVADLARQKNWGSKASDVNFAEKIALLHAEVSEALEAYRKDNLHGKDGVGEELADILIRTLHLADLYNIDIEKEISNKLKINAKRNWQNDRLHTDREKRNKSK